MGVHLVQRLRPLSSRLILTHPHNRLVVSELSRIRQLHTDNRARLSNFWIPAATVAAKDVKEDEESHSKLLRAGFLRQAHSGIYHLLPLGLRVQQKIEDLIDKHMRSVGASKLALSSISSEALWERSGRLQSIGAELWRLSDRKKAKYLLGPTHEEEITHMVSQTVKSFKDLPIRLYQITRKYRDEARPRHGLLRSREFTMKDLYTFDLDAPRALRTYAQVRAAYDALFAELGVPVLVAEASSGDMGGDLSHEYHLATSLGEDRVVSCDDDTQGCGYVANAEMARTRAVAPAAEVGQLRVWRGITRDRKTLVNVWYPGRVVDGEGKERTFDDEEVNVYALKELVPDLDAGIEDPLPLWQETIDKSQAPSSPDSTAPPSLLNLIDGRLPPCTSPEDLTSLLASPLLPLPPSLSPPTATLPSTTLTSHPPTSDITTTTTATTTAPSTPLNLLAIQPSDPCPNCSTGHLRIQKAIELAHTFHLGTRYSLPLSAAVTLPGSDGSPTPLQMGCHGIGVSRILAAAADHLSTPHALSWPRAIAPYDVAVLAGHNLAAAAEEVYDALFPHRSGGGGGAGSVRDAVLDDREGASLGWKMKDADLVGYPVVVVVGKAWTGGGRRCEVQCRRLGVREVVRVEELAGFVGGLLEKL